MPVRSLLPFAAAALILAGCADVPAPVPVQTEDTTGAARSCTVTPADLPKGAAATAQMQVGNDGGWCAVRITDKDGTAYLYPKLTKRPAHGVVKVQTVSSRTRVEYTPASGYAGTDTFTLALAPKDKSADVPVTVAVTVTK